MDAGFDDLWLFKDGDDDDAQNQVHNPRRLHSFYIQIRIICRPVQGLRHHKGNRQQQQQQQMRSTVRKLEIIVVTLRFSLSSRAHFLYRCHGQQGGSVEAFKTSTSPKSRSGRRKKEKEKTTTMSLGPPCPRHIHHPTIQQTTHRAFSGDILVILLSI